MKVVLLIIDSFGIGELPDASGYGDEGSNTALHICRRFPESKWPYLKALGLGNCGRILGFDLPGCEAVERPFAGYGVMAEKSPGKDTTTGHWELAGVELERPFILFPPEFPSFPESLLGSLKSQTGLQFLGNKAASGTVIIQELGEQHNETGRPIVYTSGDSVLQIAAHEDIIPIDKLYGICQIARKICDEYNVGRVIARPFSGIAGEYIRTERRKDFGMPPSDITILDHLSKKGVETVGVGKIGDIFSERGIDRSLHDKGNKACLERTLELLSNDPGRNQFIFVNLVDTDMNYGHRRNVKGYLDAVSEIDEYLPEMEAQLRDGDVMAISADHGCDPTFKGTDHTREYVPLLWLEKGGTPAALGVREQFSDMSQSLCSVFKVSAMKNGVSFARA